MDKITALKVKNWKNIPDIDIENIGDMSVIIGPNASGKSNFLDILVFLRDLVTLGLKGAVRERQDMSYIKALAGRRGPVHIEVSVSLKNHAWKYIVEIQRLEKQKGVSEEEASRPRVVMEEIWKNGIEIGQRDVLANKDNRQYATYLENSFTNTEYQSLVNFFENIDLLHIVPQMVKERRTGETEKKELDKYGRNFIERIGRTPKNTRNKYLKNLTRSLQGSIPGLSSIELGQDKYSKVYHLVARFTNWRGSTAKHNENSLSDGTLRLIGILWTIFEKKSGILLIDEPEISLHNHIVRDLPKFIIKAQMEQDIQVFVTTHSSEFISSEYCPKNAIFMIETKQKSMIKKGEEVTNTTNTITLIASKKKVSEYLNKGFTMAESIDMDQQSMNLTLFD